MTTEATYDRSRLINAKVIGGTIEHALVDEHGFLVLVVRPKSARSKRVLVTVARDHECNGPGAVFTETYKLPPKGRVDQQPDGRIVFTNAPTKGGA